jgi:uncharacterized RDD family membrane protein YckC
MVNKRYENPDETEEFLNFVYGRPRSTNQPHETPDGSGERPPGDVYFHGNYPPPPGYGYSPYDYRQPYYQTGQLVGFWSRFVATIIDGFIVGIPTGIVTAMLSLSLVTTNFQFKVFPEYPFNWAIGMAFWGLYAWLCYSNLNGNTIGKKVMNIKLINPDGTKPGLQTFLLHYTIGYFLNGLIMALGFLWVVFDNQKQTWGQKLFKDMTVRGNW